MSEAGMHDSPAMKAGVVAAAILVAFALVTVFASRLGGFGPAAPRSAPVAQRALLVEDGADGSLALRDAASGTLVTTLQKGENNFMRVAFRGLAQARRQAGFGPDIPFDLTRYDDGRMVLADATTGRRVPLDAFGQANKQGFSRLLPPTETP